MRQSGSCRRNRSRGWGRVGRFCWSGSGKARRNSQDGPIDNRSAGYQPAPQPMRETGGDMCPACISSFITTATLMAGSAGGLAVLVKKIKRKENGDASQSGIEGRVGGGSEEVPG